MCYRSPALTCAQTLARQEPKQTCPSILFVLVGYTYGIRNLRKVTYLKMWALYLIVTGRREARWANRTWNVMANRFPRCLAWHYAARIASILREVYKGGGTCQCPPWKHAIALNIASFIALHNLFFSWCWTTALWVPPALERLCSYPSPPNLWNALSIWLTRSCRVSVARKFCCLV